MAQAAREAHEARLAAERVGGVSKLCLAIAAGALALSGGAVVFVVSRDEPPMQRAGSLVVDELTVRKLELVNEQAERVGLLEGSRVGGDIYLWSVINPDDRDDPNGLKRSQASVWANMSGAGFSALGHDYRSKVALEARHIGPDMEQPILNLWSMHGKSDGTIDNKPRLNLTSSGPEDKKTRGYFGLR